MSKEILCNARIPQYTFILIPGRKGQLLTLMAFSLLGIAMMVPKTSFQVNYPMSVHSSSPLGPSYLKRDQAFRAVYPSSPDNL